MTPDAFPARSVAEADGVQLILVGPPVPVVPLAVPSVTVIVASLSTIDEFVKFTFAAV